MGQASLGNDEPLEVQQLRGSAKIHVMDTEVVMDLKPEMKFSKIIRNKCGGANNVDAADYEIAPGFHRQKPS